MTSGTRGPLPWLLGIGAVAIILGVAADSVASGGIGGDDLLLVTVVVGTATWALVGATIASRSGNAVGWALLAVIDVLAVALVPRRTRPTP